jgi:hypothetical protein
MASTRNKNTQINYTLEQRENRQTEKYTLYPNSSGGYAYELNLPGNGFGFAAIPGDQLSHNSVDIESFLRGTGVTNLVTGKQACLTPELKNITPINIYHNPSVIMPAPLVVERNRPWPI